MAIIAIISIAKWQRNNQRGVAKWRSGVMASISIINNGNGENQK
jgi:hypothetical protein